LIAPQKIYIRLRAQELFPEIFGETGIDCESNDQRRHARRHTDNRYDGNQGYDGLLTFGFEVSESHK